jgi:uncharacterized protein YpuA (DUF1002 family)
MEEMKVEIKMSWEGLVNTLIALIENNQKEVAREELAKMGKAADLYNDITNRIEEVIIDQLKGERENNPKMDMTDQQINDMVADIIEEIYK